MRKNKKELLSEEGEAEQKRNYEEEEDKTNG